jgi:competence protein ComFC
MDYLKRAIKFLENLFFPSICEGCGKIGTYLCDKCMREKVEFVKVQKCHVCKRKVKSQKSKFKIKEGKSIMVHQRCKTKTDLDGVFVVAKYSKFIENYIGDIKYEFYYAMVDDLVRLMNFYLKKNSFFKEIIRNSVVTPMPLNPWRKRWRGFNQAGLIGVKLSKAWNTNCVKLLGRVKNTKKQVGLKRKERLKNLEGAFKVNEKMVRWLDGRMVIVVDDVMTTGATLEECAKVLKNAGVKRVYGLVVARG